jgi:hypothetical protein
MLPATQKWEKIVEELRMSHSQKNSHNGRRCKDKRNSLNSNYIRVSNFHLSIGHHTPLWDLIMEEHEKYHLPR